MRITLWFYFFFIFAFLSQYLRRHSWIDLDFFLLLMYLKSIFHVRPLYKFYLKGLKSTFKGENKSMQIWLEFHREYFFKV